MPSWDGEAEGGLVFCDLHHCMDWIGVKELLVDHMRCCGKFWILYEIVNVLPYLLAINQLEGHLFGNDHQEQSSTATCTLTGVQNRFDLLFICYFDLKKMNLQLSWI